MTFNSPQLVNRFLPTLLASCLLGSHCASAMEPVVLHKEPLPSIQPVVVVEPIAVPETIGATLLAGVGFFMLFRRRRYS